MLRVWLGDCALNFRPGGNPDARIVGPVNRAGECLSMTTKLRPFLDSVLQFRIFVFFQALTDVAYFHLKLFTQCVCPTRPNNHSLVNSCEIVAVRSSPSLLRRQFPQLSIGGAWRNVWSRKERNVAMLIEEVLRTAFGLVYAEIYISLNPRRVIIVSICKPQSNCTFRAL